LWANFGLTLPAIQYGATLIRTSLLKSRWRSEGTSSYNRGDLRASEEYYSCTHYIYFAQRGEFDSARSEMRIIVGLRNPRTFYETQPLDERFKKMNCDKRALLERLYIAFPLHCSILQPLAVVARLSLVPLFPGTFGLGSHFFYFVPPTLSVGKSQPFVFRKTHPSEVFLNLTKFRMRRDDSRDCKSSPFHFHI